MRVERIVEAACADGRHSARLAGIGRAASERLRDTDTALRGVPGLLESWGSRPARPSPIAEARAYVAGCAAGPVAPDRRPHLHGVPLQAGRAGATRVRTASSQSRPRHPSRPRFLNDLYRYELRRLRDRLVRREIAKPDYYAHVVEVRRRYPLLSTEALGMDRGMTEDTQCVVHARPSSRSCPPRASPFFRDVAARGGVGAINLGQGFPDFNCAPQLVDAVDAPHARGPQPIRADARRVRAFAKHWRARSSSCTDGGTTPRPRSA